MLSGPWVLCATLANYETHGGVRGLQLTASQSQATTWDMRLASELEAVLWDWAPTLWDLMLTPGSVRIELKCRTSSWCWRISWWYGKKHHVLELGAQLSSVTGHDRGSRGVSRAGSEFRHTQIWILSAIHNSYRRRSYLASLSLSFCICKLRMITVHTLWSSCED